jgi:hypothetical protein
MRLDSAPARIITTPKSTQKITPIFQGRVKTKDEIAARIEHMGGSAGISSVFATLAGLNGYMNQEDPAAQYLMGAAGACGVSTLGLYALSPRMPKEDEKGDIQ